MANNNQKNNQYIGQQTQNAVATHLKQINNVNDRWNELAAHLQWKKAEEMASDMFENRKLEDKMNLMKAHDIPSPPTTKISNEAAQRSREQAKNDAEFKMQYRPQVEAFLKSQGRDIQSHKMRLMIEKFVDDGLLKAKLKHRQEQIDQIKQVRPQSAPLPQTQPQPKYQNFFPSQPVSQQNTQPNQNTKVDVRLLNAQKRRNELARQHYAEQLARQKANNQGLIESASQQITKIAERSNSLTSISTSASLNQPKTQSQTSLYSRVDSVKTQQPQANPYDNILKQYGIQGIMRPQSAPLHQPQLKYPSLYPDLNQQQPQPQYQNFFTSQPRLQPQKMYPEINQQTSQTQFKPMLSVKAEMRPSTVPTKSEDVFRYPSL